MSTRKKNKSTTNPSITMDLALEKFIVSGQDFRVCWEEAQEFDEDLAPHMVFVHFPGKISNGLKENKNYDFREILRLTEEMVCEGDEEVKNVICTYFIEALLVECSDFPDVMAPVLRQLGPESRKYALAWNKFIGERSKGLEI